MKIHVGVKIHVRGLKMYVRGVKMYVQMCENVCQRCEKTWWRCQVELEGVKFLEGVKLTLRFEIEI